MAKPEKIRYSGVSVFIDGIIAKRVQEITVNTDKAVEKTKELANGSVIEYVEDTPTVNVTLNTNDVGSTDTLALLTDKMFWWNSGSYKTGPRNNVWFASKRSVGSWYIRTASSNASYRTITENDMLNGYCNLLVYSNEGTTNVTRAMWLNHCALTGFSFTYDINGNASENYTLTTDNKTWFANRAAGVRAYRCVPSQIVRRYTASSIGFEGMASSIPTGSTVYAIAINNNVCWTTGLNVVPTTGDRWYCTSNGRINVSSTYFSLRHNGTNVLSTPYASTASTSSDRITILYKPNLIDATCYGWESSAVGGFELESTASAIGGLRKPNIVAYLWNTQGPQSRLTYLTSGKMLRTQNVAINGSFGEDKLYELSRDGFYGIVKQEPPEITVTVGLIDSDLQYFAALLSSSEATAYKLKMSDFNSYNSLKVLIYKDKAQTTLLKTIDITGMRVTAENFGVSIDNNATQEINFIADNITLTPSGTAVTGGWDYTS